MPEGSNGIERYMLAMGKAVIPPIARIGNRIREEDVVKRILDIFSISFTWFTKCS
jgi:hypothetical protein